MARGHTTRDGSRSIQEAAGDLRGLRRVREKRSLGEGFYAEDWMPDGESLLCQDDEGTKRVLSASMRDAELATREPYSGDGF